MKEMTRVLMLACHRFAVALRLYWAGRELGVPAGAFQFTENVAEEGWVCTMTGLSLGAQFYTREPDAFASDLLEQCGPVLTALRREAGGWANHIHPVFTRSFSKILAAQALTLSDGLKAIQDGATELLKLESSLIEEEHDDIGFERAWIDQVLLKAYKKLGDESAAMYYAYRIAGRVIVNVAMKDRKNYPD